MPTRVALNKPKVSFVTLKTAQGHHERFCVALLPSTATLGSGSSAAVRAARASPSLCGVRASLSSLRDVMATTTETAAARTFQFFPE